MPSVGVVGGGREARWHDILHERWVRAIALVCVSISLIYDQKSLDKAFDAHWLLPWSQSHLNKLLTCGMSYEVWKHGLSVWSARARALSLSLSLSLPPSLPPSPSTVFASLGPGDNRLSPGRALWSPQN